jgi:glucose-1-phosphate thymidylyltransferase
LVGPLIVGANALVEDSTLGPNVALAAGCVVSGSTVDDSIVMEGSKILGVHLISGSVLGRGVEIRHSGQEGLHRLVVGDHGRVEVD